MEQIFNGFVSSLNGASVEDTDIEVETTGNAVDQAFNDLVG